MVKKMDSKIVFPGEFLTTAEEFVAGKNTYEDISGKIYAATIGNAQFDLSKREVSVEKGGREIELLDVGSIIEGVVIMLKPQAAIIEIYSAEKDGRKQNISQSIGAIPISLVSRGYVTTMDTKFRIGDLVRAKVEVITAYSVDASTADAELGVIRAYCSKCRDVLGLFDSQLKCITCGNEEPRKFSTLYTLKY